MVMVVMMLLIPSEYPLKDADGASRHLHLASHQR
jgi:hypothetical protein